MDTSNSTMNWIIGGVVVVVVIALGWWIFAGRSGATGANATSTSETSGENEGIAAGNEPAEQEEGSTTTGTGTKPVTTETNGESVTVQDQAAGTSVEVAAMQLSAPSWIAVRDDKSILGAGWFGTGVTSGTVPLIRATEAGKQYTVQMYKDNGDKTFDFKADMLITNASGAAIGGTFLAK